MLRRRVVLELQTGDDWGLPQDAKIAFLKGLARLRRLDRKLEVYGSDTLFPVLEISTTDRVIQKLEQLPSVVRVLPSPNFSAR